MSRLSLLLLHASYFARGSSHPSFANAFKRACVAVARAAIVGYAAATTAALRALMPGGCASITSHVAAVDRLSRLRFLSSEA